MQDTNALSRTLSFRNNERAFYSGLLKRNDVVPPAPDISQLKSFRRNIFEKHSVANLNCSWLNDLQSHVNSSRSFVADSPGFTMPCFVDCLRKLRNWAAPGSDGIQGFWIKRFPALHERLLQCYNDMFNDSSTIPSWFTKGRTILLPKSHDTTLPKNFRPITCLNVVYKLWTSCLTQVLMSHCVVNNVLHLAQKGCARGQLSCVDHLLLNSCIWHQVKSKNRSLAVAWLDYKKAYDSVPHNWIIQCLKMFHFHPTIVNCIERLLPLWSSTMFLQLPSSAPVELMEQMWYLPRRLSQSSAILYFTDSSESAAGSLGWVPSHRN